MSRILDAIGRLWPARNVADTKASAVGPLIAWEPLGQPVWAPRDYSAFAREGFMQNAIVYRSVRMIAEAAASVPLLLYEGDNEILEHPLLDLIAHPSPDQTTADFLESWYGFLLVAGNAYVEAVGLSGRLRELHVLRPDRMKVIPGPDGWPEAFEYSAGGRSVRFEAEPVAGVRPILHVKLFHPVNDHYGMSPIEAAANAIDIHNAAGSWNKALLDNAARPSGALVYAGSAGNLTGEQYARLKSELEDSYQGAKNAGRPLLLEGGLDWKALSLSPKDMDFVEAKHAAAREIALALGVPPMLLGIPGDNTYSNYQEAQRAFWRGTVLPLIARMTKAFSGWLAPAYGSGIALKPDLDQVEGLAAEREALWARLNAATFLTVNEKRAGVGYAPVDIAPPDVSPEAKAGYDPNQPRVPEGNEDGGQWTDGGGGGGSSSSGRVRVALADTGSRDDAGDSPARAVDDEPAPRVVNHYAEDGTLTGRTVENNDGSTITSEFRAPGQTEGPDERHTVTTADGETYRFETSGSTLTVKSGEDGETLVGTYEWTPEGPESRLQPAFVGPAEKAIEAALALYVWLSAPESGEEPAVLGLRANEFRPGAPDVTWVGTRTREEVDEACPRHGDVQIMTDEAADTVKREGNYITATDYGTKVHTRLAKQIKSLDDENFLAEVSRIKSREAGYGERGSVRIDVLENAPNGTVCVYDIKTGKRGLSLPRSKEIAANVYKHYPDTQRIIVIETRPRK